MKAYKKDLYGFIILLEDFLARYKNEDRPYVILKDEDGIIVECYPCSTKLERNKEFPSIKAYPPLKLPSKVLTAPEFRIELKRSIALLKAKGQKIIDKDNKIKNDYLRRQQENIE